MNKTLKIIFEKELANRIEDYRRFTNCLVELNIKKFGYHSKFETGYGWMLNASKLRDHGIISFDFYNNLFDWFDAEFKLGQMVPAEDWEDYCDKTMEIDIKLMNLIC